MNFILTLLVPMFLRLSGGDIGLARQAAAEAVDAYRAPNAADLIVIAQIVAFGMAAVDSAGQSMEEGINPILAMRLRASAFACNRSADRGRRSLVSRSSMPKSAAPKAARNPARNDTVVNAEPSAATPAAMPLEPDNHLLSPAAADMLAAESAARLRDGAKFMKQTPAPIAAPIAAPDPTSKIPQKRYNEMWAIAMVKEADDISAGIPHLPQAERDQALSQAEALRRTAGEVMSGVRSPPPLANTEAPAPTA